MDKISHNIPAWPEWVWSQLDNDGTTIYYTPLWLVEAVPIDDVLRASIDTPQVNLSQIRELLKKGANPNYRGDDGCTLLILAARHGVCEVAGLLLKYNALVDDVDGNGSTALMEALRNGHGQFVNVLLDWGANPCHANNSGETPRSVAVDSACEDLVAGVFGQNMLTGDGLSKKLHALLRNGSSVYSTVRSLLDQGVDPKYRGDDGCTLLILAARRGQYKIASLLLERGACVDDVNNTGSTALMEALKAGHHQVARVLLDWGADPRHKNNFGETLASVAVGTACGDLIAKVLEQNVPVVEDRLSKRLHALLRNSRRKYDVVCSLLDQGANPNYRGDDGCTLLMLAARLGQYKIAALLLERGARVDDVDSNGSTALMEALSGGHGQFANMLLDWRANPRHANNSGETPRSVAIGSSCKELIAMALQQGNGLTGQNHLIYPIFASLFDHKRG